MAQQIIIRKTCKPNGAMTHAMPHPQIATEYPGESTISNAELHFDPVAAGNSELVCDDS